MSRISVLAGALLLGPLSGAFAPALAQTLLPQSTPENLLGEVVALCERGKGCKCSTINTAENMLMVYGIDASVPDGFAGDQRAQTIVIDTGGGQVFRTKEPRGRINAAYGGDGPCEPADPPEMEPLDGLWHWRTLGETVAGCPPTMAQALAAGRRETIQARVQWDGVFDPQRLAAGLPSVAMAEVSPYEWRKLAPGRWLSDNIRSRTCEDGTCVSVALSLTMNLVAQDRINGLLSMRSQVEGAEAAVLAGFGMADCRVSMRYVIDRIAP